MTRPVEVEERVAQWYRAYRPVQEALTPEAFRTILATMKEADGIAQLQSYMRLAAQVMANDRMAAMVAGMLTSTGIKPVPFEYEGNLPGDPGGE